VQIAPTFNGFNLYDGTVQTPPTKIDFKELIGQPTWKDISTISFNRDARRRAIRDVGARPPPRPQIISPASNSAYRDQTTFRRCIGCPPFGTWATSASVTRILG